MWSSFKRTSIKTSVWTTLPFWNKNKECGSLVSSNSSLADGLNPILELKKLNLEADFYWTELILLHLSAAFFGLLVHQRWLILTNLDWVSRLWTEMLNRNRSVEQALTEMEFDISSLTPKWKSRLLISPNSCGKIGDDLLEDTYANIPFRN